MNNPFSTKPKWRTGKWGEMPENAITPMPQVVTKGNQEMTSNIPKGTIAASKTVEKPWKKYIIPIAIIVGTLVTVAIVAIIVFIIRNRNNKNNGQQPPKKQFTPGKNILHSENQMNYPEEQPVKIQENVEEELNNVAEVAKKLGISQEEKKTKKVPTIKQLMEEYEKILQGSSEEETPPVKRKKSKDGPPLEEPLPRLSFKEIQDKTHRKTISEESEDENVKLPNNLKKNSHLTAAYLTSLLDQIKNNENDEEIGVIEEDK